MRGYRFLSLGLLLAVISGVLDCSDPPNPFLDITKSRASVYSKTFEDRDTIPIFSFETLTVAIYLKEHLREVSVHIDHNRLGTSDDTIISIDSYDGDLVFIPFSFYDTGWQHIEVRSLKNTGEIVSEKYELYAMLPLYQKTIRGRTGESVRLKTTPVEDKSVIYVWDFHNGTVIKDYSNEVSIVLSKNFTSTIGELYVTDPLSKSPSVPFSIDTGAINKLEIICQNDSLLFDSVYTGQSNFTFKVLVNGAGHLSSATVNGEPFDVVVSSNGSFMINKMFNRLDTVQGAIRAAVSVTDDLDRFVEKVFYIHYNNAVSAATPKIILNIPATLNDTGYVMLQKVALFGEIRGNITVNQLFIQVFLNGKFAGAQKILPPGYSWTFPVQLNNSWNSVQFQLTKDSLLVDSVMAVKTVALNSNPDEIDKIPPVINQIKIDGVIANREKNVIRNKDVLMSILVSDNKRVSFVTVNGNRADSDSNNLLFTAQISLEHSTVGVPYIVCAEDSDGNKTCDTVTVSYNNIPEITDYRIPSTMIVDTEYVFTVNATDPDKDSLITTITLKGGAVDTVLTLLNSTVRWKPSLKDTGALQLKIHVFDPFFESADLVQTVYVIVQKNQAVPVSIRTTADDFPDTLFVGGSPLTVLLHVDTLTGTPPVSFTVYLKNQSRKIYDSSNPMFVWSPVRSDAGVQTLQVVAHDKSAFSDTLTVMIPIVAHPAATVYLFEDSLVINEGGKNDSITVAMNKALKDTVRVPYVIKFSSANSSDIGLDSSGEVLFFPGDTLVKVPIGIVDDTNSEPEENFYFTLLQLPPLSAKDSIVVDKNRSELKVIIKDNDGNGSKIGVMLQPPYIPNVPEFAFLGQYPGIVLTSALPFDLTVTLKSTSNATAFPGTDYIMANQKITVKAGQTFASLQLMLIDDWVHEETEYIELEISEISNTSSAYIAEQKVTRIQVIDND